MHPLLHLFVWPERLAPSPLSAVQRHEGHWGRGLASTVDVEDIRRTNLGLLQQSNGQYGAGLCHVGAKHLCWDVHFVWTWLQDAGDSLVELHTFRWSQCPPGHVVPQNKPSFIPKESQLNLYCRCLRANFFSVLVKRYGAIPCSLSWFAAGNSGPRLHLPEQFFLENHHNLLQSVSKVPGRHQHVFFQFCGQLAWHAPCRHFMELQNVTGDMVCWSMTHIQMCGYFIHCYAAIFLHDGSNCCNDLWCHYSVCLTKSRRVCYRTNAVHELSSPLVHLL